MLLRTVTIVLPDPSFLSRLVAVLLCSSAGIVAGAALALSRAQIIRRASTDHPWAYWRLWIGIAIAVGLIAYLVAKNPVVDVGDWHLWVFTASMMLAASGAIELFWRAFAGWRRRRRNRSALLQ